MSAALNSFELDELCREHLRQHNIPVVDYPELTLVESLDHLNKAHRREVWLTAAFCVSLGFLAGMATLALPSILWAI